MARRRRWKRKQGNPRKRSRRPAVSLEIARDPAESAQAAGLRYVSDAMPGIRRKKAGTGFSYLSPEGKTIKDAAQLARIRIRFEFRGKSGKSHSVSLSDRRLARIVQRCQALPGEDLFQYIDDEGVRQTIGSGDVNDYLRAASGQDFTAKDFRTWSGTKLAVMAFTRDRPLDLETSGQFERSPRDR